MTTGAAPRAAETAERRRRLVAAAVELARDGGYEAVHMRDVAARADVALATLYRQYSSKDQLLLAALADQSRTLRDHLAARPVEGRTPHDRVARVLTLATRALTREPTLTAAMVTALGSPEPQAAATKLEILDLLGGIVRDAGDLGDGEDDAAAMRTLGYVWLAVLSAWSSGMVDDETMTEDLATAAELLLATG